MRRQRTKIFHTTSEVIVWIKALSFKITCDPWFRWENCSDVNVLSDVVCIAAGNQIPGINPAMHLIYFWASFSVCCKFNFQGLKRQRRVGKWFFPLKYHWRKPEGSTVLHLRTHWGWSLLQGPNPWLDFSDKAPLPNSTFTYVLMVNLYADEYSTHDPVTLQKPYSEHMGLLEDISHVDCNRYSLNDHHAQM